MSVILAPEEALDLLRARIQQKMARQLLPARHLRVNRREVKQVYNKYKPKKRDLPPPAPLLAASSFLTLSSYLKRRQRQEVPKVKCIEHKVPTSTPLFPLSLQDAVTSITALVVIKVEGGVYGCSLLPGCRAIDL